MPSSTLLERGGDNYRTTTDRKMTGTEMHLMKWMTCRALVLTALTTAATGLSPALAQNGDDDPIPATTESGEAVLLNPDGSWEWVEAESDDSSEDAGSEPSAIALGELINRSGDYLGDVVAVEAEIRCFSQSACDIISDEGEFYSRENVDVTIDDLERSDRLMLLEECGRFAARCRVTVVAMVDLNRYDALVLRAESIERL